MRLVPAGTSICLPSMLSFGMTYGALRTANALPLIISGSTLELPVGGGLDGPLRSLPPESDCAGQAGARTSSRSSFRDQRLELVAEFLDVGDVGPDGAVVEGADGGAGAPARHVQDGVQILLAAVAGEDAL